MRAMPTTRPVEPRATSADTLSSFRAGGAGPPVRSPVAGQSGPGLGHRTGPDGQHGHPGPASAQPSASAFEACAVCYAHGAYGTGTRVTPSMVISVESEEFQIW